MKFMVLVPANSESEAGQLPTEKELAAMGKFNEELVKAGVLLAGEGLQPTSKGARIRFGEGKPKVVDGPFTESKELVAGFWIIQAKSKEEAVAYMSRAPFGPGVTISSTGRLLPCITSGPRARYRYSSSTSMTSLRNSANGKRPTSKNSGDRMC